MDVVVVVVVLFDWISKLLFDMRRLICNEFLSLNAFGFVFYDFLRLQRFVLVLVFLAFDFLAFVFLAFDLVLLVFLVFDLAPPLGIESNICLILVDFS